METDSNECVRQLRKRPEPTKENLISSKIQKINSENQNKKSVNLLEKYFPFFLEQQNLLNELRKSVREEQTTQSTEKTSPPSSDESTKSQQDGDDTVVKDELLEKPTDSNTRTNQEVSSAIVVDCESAGEDNPCSHERDLIECETLQTDISENAMQIDIINQHVLISSSNPDPCPSKEYTLTSSVDDQSNLCLEETHSTSTNTGEESENVGERESSEEYLPSSNSDEISCENLADISSPWNENVWQCKLVEDDTSSVPSDDAIECELSREDCGDKERFPEDSIEYNILYVSENSKHSQYNLNEVGFPYSDLSSDTDEVPYQFSDNQNSQDSYSDLEQQKQITSPTNSGENTLITSQNPSHIQQQNVTLDDALFPCEFCSSHFNTSADLDCHLNTHRGTELIVPSISSTKVSDKKYKVKDRSVLMPRYYCSVCYRPYNSVNGLKYHLKWHKSNSLLSDNDLNSENETHSKEFEPIPIPKGKTKYQCFYCSFSVATKQIWLDHLVHHQIKNQYYSCPQCEFRIWHRNLLIYHLAGKHKKYFNSHIINPGHSSREIMLPHLTAVQLRALKAFERYASLGHKPKVYNTNKLKSNKMGITLPHGVSFELNSEAQKIEKKDIETQVATQLSIEQPSIPETDITDKSRTLSKHKKVKEPIPPIDTIPNKTFSLEKVHPYLLVCIYCEKYFRTKEDRVLHMFTHIDATTSSFPCPLCLHSYKFPNRLLRHYFIVHKSIKRLHLKNSGSTYKRNEDKVISK